MYHRDGRAIVARDAVEPTHLGVRIEGDQQAKRVWNLDRVARLPVTDDPADRNRRVALRGPERFERGELRRLMLGIKTGDHVAHDPLQRDRNGRDHHRDRQPGADLFGAVPRAAAQQRERAHGGRAEAGHHVRGERRVKVLDQPGRAEHGGDRIDVDDLAVVPDAVSFVDAAALPVAVVEPETGRHVHPGVRQRDERGRNGTADGDR